jgi:UDP-glucose 4-epimerase
MKILVTGGAGYIGSHACIELLESGFEVMVIDSLVNGNIEAITRVQEITNKKIIFIESCLSNYDLIKNHITEFSPVSIIHFAGLKAVNESVIDPINYYFNNVLGTINLLKVMDIVGIKNIIFSSSATVYGTPSYLPYDESHPLNPVNPYGNTKLAVEKILEDWSKADKKNKAVSLRYFNPIGAHNSSRIGEDPRGVPRNIMPFITQVAIGKRPFLNIFGNDYKTRDGTCERDFVDVNELARAHICAVKNVKDFNNFECFNIGSGYGITVLELVNSFEKATGIKIPIKFSGRRAGDLPSFYASCIKANNLLKWKHSSTPEEMCNSNWKWQLNNPQGYINSNEQK